uniref:Uncharacterized protein n=1 Tax=Arion vulgaris TaxID=1028688 RepID=A0A0B7BE17_9EUPU
MCTNHDLVFLFLKIRKCGISTMLNKVKVGTSDQSKSHTVRLTVKHPPQHCLPCEKQKDNMDVESRIPEETYQETRLQHL